MAEPFMGEIRVMSFGFAPKGWALCDGQLLPINQNQALFSLLGTMYGGNGQTTFGLPDFRGRTPVHTQSADQQPGEHGGEQSHTLTLAETPQHSHILRGTNTPAETGTPDASTFLAEASATYTSASVLTPMGSSSLSSIGGSQSHQNMQPYLTLTFCIALQGIFPSVY